MKEELKLKEPWITIVAIVSIFFAINILGFFSAKGINDLKKELTECQIKLNL